MVITRGKGGWRKEVVMGKGGQMYGDWRRLEFGWWAHKAVYR